MYRLIQKKSKLTKSMQLLHFNKEDALEKKKKILWKKTYICGALTTISIF